MTKFRIEGLRDLEKTLMDLPRATRKNTMRRVLKNTGQILAADARRRAPRDEYNLLESIDVLSTARPPQRKKSDLEVYVGPGRHPQAITQEFGTFFHKAQPFMRPAWDATQTKILRELEFSLFDEVEKSVARARRKAAKAGG